MHFSSDPVSLLSKKCKVYSSTYTTTFFIIDDSDIQKEKKKKDLFVKPVMKISQ